MFGAYSSSKTALNAITLACASALESTDIKVNAACPGFTATDLNNFRGTRTVQQAAREPVRLGSSTRTVRPAQSRTRTARSRGDLLSNAWPQGMGRPAGNPSIAQIEATWRNKVSAFGKRSAKTQANAFEEGPKLRHALL